MTTDKIDILKMQTARALMEEGHKTVARSVLQTCSHPKAPEWLAKLPEEGDSVSSGKRSPAFLVGIILFVALIGGFSFIVGRISAPQASVIDVPLASPTPNTQEFAATLQATHDALQDKNQDVLAALTLTAAAAPPTTTPFGNK